MDRPRERSMPGLSTWTVHMDHGTLVDRVQQTRLGSSGEIGKEGEINLR